MSDALAGKALTPLHELVDAAGFPLSALIDAQQYAAIFDRFYVSDADAYVEDGELHTDVELLYQGVLALPVPPLQGFQLVFNSPTPGWTLLRASLALDENPACLIRGASIALEVPPLLLQDVVTGSGSRIGVTGDVLISGAGLSFVNVAGATLAPARLSGTGAALAIGARSLDTTRASVPSAGACKPSFRIQRTQKIDAASEPTIR